MTIKSIGTADDELDLPLISRLRQIGERGDDAAYLDTLNEALRRVVTKDSGEALIPLNRESLGDKVFVWLVELGIQASEVRRLQLRASVVEKLKHAADNLPDGYSLIIRDAFRDEQTVWDLYALYTDRLRTREPHLSESERDLRIRNILAMPDDPVPPGHMTGGAVDVNLGDASGRRIDLEVPEAVMSRKQQAPMNCDGLPFEIVHRRRILFDALNGQGFHNYFREYWHFSYGDAYWAVRRREKIAIYGIPTNQHTR